MARTLLSQDWALLNYTPENEPGPKQEEELSELPVRCPKCHSTEVIIDHLSSEPTTTTDNSQPKFEWACDSCGHKWEDGGTVKEE